MPRKKKTPAPEDLEGQTYLAGMEPPPPPDPLWKVKLTATAKRAAFGEPHDLEALDIEDDQTETDLWDEELKRTVEVTVPAPARDDAIDAGRKQIAAKVGELEDLFDDYGSHHIVSHRLDVKRA